MISQDQVAGTQFEYPSTKEELLQLRQELIDAGGSQSVIDHIDFLLSQM